MEYPYAHRPLSSAYRPSTSILRPTVSYVDTTPLPTLTTRELAKARADLEAQKQHVANLERLDRLDKINQIAREERIDRLVDSYRYAPAPPPPRALSPTRLYTRYPATETLQSRVYRDDGLCHYLPPRYATDYPPLYTNTEAEVDLALARSRARLRSNAYL